MNCKVLENRTIARGFNHLSLAPDKPLGPIIPGQFVMIRVRESMDPLLRRPMSVAGFKPDGSSFGLVIQRIGRGTEILASLAAGDRVDVIGPFGAGFPEPPGAAGELWIVAGGSGVAPFVGMLQPATRPVCRTRVFLGARNSGFLLCADHLSDGADVFLTATEDGSAGVKGVVTDLVERELANGYAPAMIFACGPAPMMRALEKSVSGRDVRLCVSLENRMACGFGACLGCVTKLKTEQRYVAVCRKGPVFDASTIQI